MILLDPSLLSPYGVYVHTRTHEAKALPWNIHGIKIEKGPAHAAAPRSQGNGTMFRFRHFFFLQNYEFSRLLIFLSGYRLNMFNLGPQMPYRYSPTFLLNCVFQDFPAPSEHFLETLPKPSENIPKVLPNTSQHIPKFTKK